MSFGTASDRPARDEHHDRAGGAGWARIAPWAEPALTVLFFVGLFELFAASGLAGKGVMPSVPNIASAFWVDITHRELWDATWITLRSWMIAMAIVVAIGVPGGFLMGSSQVAYHGSHLTVEILRTIPSIAALPFLVLVYGVGAKLTVILVVLAALWPLLLQTMAGARDVDPVARDTGRSYGLGRFDQFRRIMLPSALPYVATGIRISATIGLLLAIGTSLYAGGQGLGNEINVAQGEFKTPLLFARVFFAGLLGLVVYYVLITIERRLLAWHPSYRVVLVKRLRLLGLELLVPVALIALWWWRSSGSKAPYFPPLSQIVSEFKTVYIWHGLRTDVLYSLGHFAIGFAFGVALGFSIGLLLGLSARTRRNVAPVAEFFRAMPIVAVIPIGLVMVGPGLILEAGLIAVGSTWAVMLNTADGVRGVDPIVVETARSYGLSRAQQIRKVIVPAAMPQVLAGVRVAVGLGITVMIVANMFISTEGLGAQVAIAQENFQIKDAWAGILMIGIVGIVITALYTVIHNRLLAWHRGWRASAGAT